MKPAGKDYIWGGQRLNDDFRKNIPLEPLAETWECSTHPDGESVVASGKYKGLGLRKLLAIRPDFLGTHSKQSAGGALPVLIKFIDAQKDLSVQVHPSDEYARIFENGQSGKFEMWYVIDAKLGARLVYGFREDMTEEKLRRCIADGSIEQYLQYVPVHKGDVFSIKPGMVHAIGGGILLAEIQESSNLTYRLYDYNRVGKDGKKRKLHIEKALDVVNLKSSAGPHQTVRQMEYKTGCVSELIGRCPYFEVKWVRLNTEQIRTKAEIRTGGESFAVILCIDGCADLFGEGTLIHIFKGDCVFIPANSVKLRLYAVCRNS